MIAVDVLVCDEKNFTLTMVSGGIKKKDVVPMVSQHEGSRMN